MNTRTIFTLLLALWGATVATASLAQSEVHIGSLSNVDLQFMAQQRSLLQDLTASKLGRQFSGDRERDLALLQALLDKQLVKASQTRELQAMGIVMGDLLAADLDMHWVIYEDKIGRSRALRYKDSDNYLFPVTMISRRREVGNKTSVVDIYHKAHEILSHSIPPLPFQ